MSAAGFDCGDMPPPTLFEAKNPGKTSRKDGPIESHQILTANTFNSHVRLILNTSSPPILRPDGG
jgi:hypothetical protein